ncbi:recombination regulator RecX [Nitrosomonas sp. HPC101]|uniref:recombination regulator RecX n=1 Tax=Nitrosomonas sp. HPC101 TaxID=1658667 RepID=UPI00136B6CFC|nr:recombination regulator RecX [Nitrosomonas sp. HPC101]MXS85132.1 recombination regulator RecX [Nitrosomonas sp. HPC101]
MSLYARALSYLARREYSRQELEKKLSRHEHTLSELKNVLDRLEQQKLLSDERAAEQLLHARRRKYGSRRIRYELRMKGIADHLVDAAMKDFEQTEFSSAQALWGKKFGVVPSTPEERGRQIRYLAGKGFPSEVISKVLSDTREAEN